MTEPRDAWVGFSASRVGVIALNTLTESVRQKVYNILLVFGLVVIATASFFAQFNFGEGAGQAATEQLKFIKDFCLGAVSVFGMLIAVVGTAQLLPRELENRTIYTILSKPVRRGEFLLGKFGGMVLLVGVSVVLMGLMFAAILWFKERTLALALVEATGGRMDEEVRGALAQIRGASLDGNIVRGLLLITLKLWLLAAITLLVSTFSTSMVFNVTVTVLVFFAGHLVGTAKELWAAHSVALYLLGAIPDLGMFNVTDDIVLGNPLPWEHVGKVAGYWLLYLTVTLGAAHLVFRDREI